MVRIGCMANSLVRVPWSRQFWPSRRCCMWCVTRRGATAEEFEHLRILYLRELFIKLANRPEVVRVE